MLSAQQPLFWLFAALSLLASFLLFFIQPLIAKLGLPQLGGNPAVWTSAVLAFQILLLIGYGYAHWLLSWPKQVQFILHSSLIFVALLWLPLGFDAADAPHDGNLAFWVPWRVMVAVGPLFVLLAAQSALLQGWLRDHSGEEPYVLYRYSNMGSLLGLLAFPLIFEPLATLAAVKLLWSMGFVLYVLALAILMFAMFQTRTLAELPSTKQQEVVLHWPGWETSLYWITLAAVPSGLILSTTTHVTTDIVAMPLLWVLPLALYLSSFVVAFSDNFPLLDRVTRFAVPLIAGLGLLAFCTDAFEIYVTGPASMAMLFVAGLVLHRKLYLGRPSASGLTSFYLLLAVGGALGGLLVAVVAPLLFDWSYEFPILWLAAVALTQNSRVTKPSVVAFAVSGIATVITVAEVLEWSNLEATWYAALAALAIIPVRHSRVATVAVALSGFLRISGIDYLYLGASGQLQRSYFGIYTISENEAGTLRSLIYGTTSHGVQSQIAATRREPSSYFGRQSGVGLVLDNLPTQYAENARIGVVGLGVGTLACYARQGQKWTFYEIDPVVVDIAIRQRWFSYLVDCAPEAVVQIGDARLTLTKQDSQSLDVLVIDAFSSDALPAHLYTKEAYDIYDRVLAQNGTLLIHISNRYLDLEPALEKEARERGWYAALRKNLPNTAQKLIGEKASVWVTMSRSQKQMELLIGPIHQGITDWRPLNATPDSRRWSDDFSSVFSLLKLGKVEKWECCKLLK